MRGLGNEIQAVCQPLEETCEQLQREMHSLENFTHQLLDELNTLHKELLQRAATVDTLQTELNQQRRDNVRLLSRFEQQEAQLATTLQELVELRSALPQLVATLPTTDGADHQVATPSRGELEELERLREENEQLYREREELLRERDQQEHQVQEEMQSLRDLAASLLERATVGRKAPLPLEPVASGGKEPRTTNHRAAASPKRDYRRNES